MVFAQSPQSVPAAVTPATVADSTIHYKGPGVTAPELLSVSGTFDPIDHCKKLDGEEQILIAVDRTGSAQRIKVLKSLGNDLDAMARHVAELDKFNPGTVDGGPAIVALSDDIRLQACRVEKKDAYGIKQNYLQLRSAPEQTFELIDAPSGALTQLPPKPEPATAAWDGAMHDLYRVGVDVTRPVLIHQVDPEFTPEARKAKYGGVCMVSVVVDTNGNPQNARVVRPLGMGLDEKAIEAIKQFRFKPALKDGKTPVPVMITVEVNFRSFDGGPVLPAPLH